MSREETIFKMVECANELCNCYGDYLEALAIFQTANVLCRIHNEDMPDEGLRLQETLNEKLKAPRLSDECLHMNVGNYIKMD